MTDYGVTVRTQSIPMILVDGNGYANKETVITYTIAPPEYKAFTAYVLIYKDNSIVAQIPAETQETGTATISGGFQFDPNSKYEAEVILNYGTGVEIRGVRVTIPVAQVRVLTDESISTVVDEIKFSDGSKGSNGTKKYHIAIQSQLWLSSCETLTGRIVTLSTTTGIAGQPVSTPQDTGDAYAAGYTLKFEHPALPVFNKLCNVKIVDTLDNGALKEKFIVSNRPRTALDVGQPYSNIDNTAVLYVGIGNKFWVEVGGVGIAVPIEPVGIVILGIDGLRQDVLYEQNEQSVVDRTGPASPYHTTLSEIKGFCTVMGGKYDDGILGVGTSCDPTGADNKHIKRQNVTTIFPSITFAAWASIFTGMTPSATGITGNEFFARDMLANYETIPGMYMLPSGMVTLDADGGAFRPLVAGGTYSLLSQSLPFILNYIMPADFDVFSHPTLQAKLDASAPGHVLRTGVNPLWADINTLVTKLYKRSSGARCDTTANECRTVTMFNQYADGADSWGTPSAVSGSIIHGVMNTGNSFSAAVMDSFSADETAEFIKNYFLNNTSDGKRKRFPALLSVDLSGLDHTAHLKGMDEYVNYVKSSTDSKIEKIVKALKDKDEFDNKIFIIVSDHGHTAMPTNLTYRDRNWLGIDSDKPIDMSCELKTDFVDIENPTAVTRNQKSELENNSLHIWELGEMFKDVGKFTGGSLGYRVLAPDPIAKLFSRKEAYGARSLISEANVRAALNGPMAHIYLTDQDDMGEVAEVFRLTMQTENITEAGEWLGLSEDGYADLKDAVGRLQSSIGQILVRLNENYCVFDGLNDDGSPKCTISDPFNGSAYIDAWTRIEGLNHKDRSGDIVLIMKDMTTGDAIDRYTTAYACKSWHGSLNPSDSYVPFIISYPGGNKNEMEPILKKDTVCNADYSNCKNNWKLPTIVRGIISEQYK